MSVNFFKVMDEFKPNNEMLKKGFSSGKVVRLPP